jgi:hypothetical protein
MAKKLSHFLLNKQFDNDEELTKMLKIILNSFFKDARKVSKEDDFEDFLIYL